MEVEDPRTDNGEERERELKQSKCEWPSSRIVRVSRASGGKDRHSKVWTSKGLRDRRVRLSVNTAVQFYDLQDRLGFDQPSKALEWLLKAAAPFIEELPSLDASFPGDKQISPYYSCRGSGGGEGLSLSRGRGAQKGKEKGKSEPVCSVSQNSSFTELLASGNGGGRDGSNFFVSGDFPGQIPLFGDPNHHHFSFVSDQHRHSSSSNNEYNLNFSISSPPSSSSGLAGFRGTLQSNSSNSFSAIDGAPTSFFTASAPTAAVDNNHHHHHFLNALDAPLQLYYGESPSGHKSNEKN